MNDIIVIKLGTNALKEGSMRTPRRLNPKVFQAVARQIAVLLRSGKKVAIVTSGAIQAGKETIPAGHARRFTDTELASIGASVLMNFWSEAFLPHELIVGQILVTYKNLIDPEEQKSVIGNIRGLLEKGVIPIINENDPVSAEEVELLKNNMGDNDALTSMIAPLIGATHVLFLTGVPYVYVSAPTGECPNPTRYRKIDCNNIPPHLQNVPIGIGDSHGGITSKVVAAAVCAQNGMKVAITRFELDKYKNTILGFMNSNSHPLNYVGTVMGHCNDLE